MGNISNREKIMIFVLGAALVALIMFVAIIRPLMNKNDKADATLEERKKTDAYYVALIQSNGELEQKIANTKNGIMDIEAKLLPEVDTWSVEQYLINTFSSNGNDFGKGIKSEEIVCDDINMPDGTVANERLKLKRFTVSYTTNDGFCIPESDGNPAWFKDGLPDEELIVNSIINMGNPEAEDPYNFTQVKGYDEFINALDEISKKFPTCVKVHSCSVEDSTVGFLNLKAEIDCFSTDLASSRLLDVKDSRQTKFVWEGEENVDCAGGLIGMPLINTNEASAYFGVQIAPKALSDFKDRPFASYFSAAILSDIAANNTSLYDEEGKSYAATYEPTFEGETAQVPGEGADAGADAGADEPAA